MMAGPPGRSGQSARSRVVQELSKEVAHVMPPVIPALDHPFRHASAAWQDVTAVVRTTIVLILDPCPFFYDGEKAAARNILYIQISSCIKLQKTFVLF